MCTEHCCEQIQIVEQQESLYWGPICPPQYLLQYRYGWFGPEKKGRRETGDHKWILRFIAFIKNVVVISTHFQNNVDKTWIMNVSRGRYFWAAAHPPLVSLHSLRLSVRTLGTWVRRLDTTAPLLPFLQNPVLAFFDIFFTLFWGSNYLGGWRRLYTTTPLLPFV